MSSDEEALLKSALAAKAAAATNLTLDPDTVCSYLILSGDTTATKGPWQGYPERLERFNPCPQVLCKEHLTEHHYFEVEWGTCQNNVVGVGLAYKSIARKGERKTTGFGFNNVSWFFGINNKSLEAWYNDKMYWSAPVPSTGCSRVGVYLDWPGGSLSFYNVSSSILTRLYTFKAKFTSPLYPGVYVGNDGNHATVCPV